MDERKKMDDGYVLVICVSGAFKVLLTRVELRTGN